MTTMIETERPMGQLLPTEALPLSETEQQAWDAFVAEFTDINTDLETMRRQAQAGEAGAIAVQQEVADASEQVRVPRSTADAALELKRQKSDMIDDLIGDTPGQALSLEMRYLAGLYKGRTDTWRLADGTEISWFGTRADHNLTIQEEYMVATAPDGSRRFGLYERRPDQTVYYDIRDDGSMNVIYKNHEGGDAGRAFVPDASRESGRRQHHSHARITIDNTLSTAGEVRKRDNQQRAAADAAAMALYGDVGRYRQLKAAASMAEVEHYIADLYKSDHDAPGLPFRISQAGNLPTLDARL